MSPIGPTRDEVAALITESGESDTHDYVREKLLEQYPELADQTVRRGGQTYNAIDYLMKDVVEDEGN